MQIKLSKKDFKKDKVFKIILEGLRYPAVQRGHINEILLEVSDSDPVLPY